MGRRLREMWCSLLVSEQFVILVSAIWTVTFAVLPRVVPA